MPFTVLGVFIGALLVQYASYHWVFWFVAIVAIPIALGCLFIIPSELAKPSNEPDASSTKWKSLDLIGISILTGVSHPRELLLACGVNWLPSVALILFIYAVTSGSSDGWATAGVLAPLIISIFLIVGFFYWETLIPFENAAMYVTPFLPRVHEFTVLRARPPCTWFYSNFFVLFGSALYPLFWWSATFLVFTAMWQDVFHWTVISTAIHL